MEAGALLLAVGDVDVTNAQLGLIALVVLFAVLVPRVIRKAWSRKSGAGLAGLRERVEDAEQEARARRTVDRALSDLLETSRDINAQIDTKIRILNKLVKDADREARRLEKLQGREVGGAEESKAQPAGGDAAEEHVGGAREDRAGDPEERRGPSGGSESRRRWRAMRERIGHLQAEGRAPAEIARVTRLSVQEVNVILRLADDEKKA